MESIKRDPSTDMLQYVNLVSKGAGGGNPTGNLADGKNVEATNNKVVRYHYGNAADGMDVEATNNDTDRTSPIGNASDGIDAEDTINTGKRHPKNKNPMDGIDVEAVDQMLSGVLNQMSFEERNAAQDEVHGVLNICPRETPETVQASLIELSHAIAMSSMPEKSAFLEAQALPTTYVNEDWFRIRFLRANVYDICKATKRLLIFLHHVKKYFGMIGLQRPIQLSDLSA